MNRTACPLGQRNQVHDALQREIRSAKGDRAARPGQRTSERGFAHDHRDDLVPEHRLVQDQVLNVVRERPTIIDPAREAPKGDEPIPDPPPRVLERRVSSLQSEVLRGESLIDGTWATSSFPSERLRCLNRQPALRAYDRRSDFRRGCNFALIGARQQRVFKILADLGRRHARQGVSHA